LGEAAVSERPHANLLYLVHRLPYPPDKGDRIRSFHLLRCLSRRTAVHLACLADEPVPDDALVTLRRYCARVAVVRLGATRWLHALRSLALGGTITEGAFRSSALQTIVRDWAREVRFDAALASASSMVPYLKQPELRHVPAVVDLVDVDSQKWQDYADISRGAWTWLFRLESRRLRRLEQHLPQWTRAITLVSEPEAELYRRLCPDGTIHAVTNGVDQEYFRPTHHGEERGCAFVGALNYWPNVAGITWFSREVWPALVAQRPHERLAVIGRRPVPAVAELAKQPGIDLVGQVADVRPYVSRAAVVLAPLAIARGVQNKVLEALAMGKAVVVSPQALLGLKVQPGVHLLSASTAAEWQEAVHRLLTDERLRHSLGTAGRHFVETHHRWDGCLQPLADLLGLGPEPQPLASLEEVA
jgi:sugar transferase (PEP-CTERM/EpsH1 system associated)